MNRDTKPIVILTRQYRYALLTKRKVKMAGYWPSSFFAFLWNETKSRSIKTQKKNEQAWSIKDFFLQVRTTTTKQNRTS